MESSILIGNGVNLLKSGIGWDRLLKDIADDYGAQSIVIQKDKSYPLTFEEILFSRPTGDFSENLKELKVSIAEKFRSYKPNRFHDEIVNMSYSHILTTNYDYNLERCFIDGYEGLNNPGNAGERKHSLKRVKEISNKFFWHINGELNNGYTGDKQYAEASILIGHEHYADYLNKIHNEIKPKEKKGGLTGTLEKWGMWPPIFFSTNLDIIGFSLDFTEIHLWWILNYRARLEREGRISFNNIIRFFIPSFEEVKYKNKLSLLNSLNVETIAIKSDQDDYEQFYDKFINGSF